VIRVLLTMCKTPSSTPQKKFHLHHLVLGSPSCAVTSSCPHLIVHVCVCVCACFKTGSCYCSPGCCPPLCPLASISQVLGLQVCTTMPSPLSIFPFCGAGNGTQSLIPAVPPALHLLSTKGDSVRNREWRMDLEGCGMWGED
jgi:hypothetical protein